MAVDVMAGVMVDEAVEAVGMLQLYRLLVRTKKLIVQKKQKMIRF
jgi:hypothetical protein